MRRLVFSIVLVACQTPAPAPHVALHAAPSRVAPKKDRCSPLLDENTKSLATWSDALAKADKASRAKLEGLLQFCVPGKDGAWSLAIDGIQNGNADDPNARLVLLALRYRFDDGRDIEAAPKIRGDEDVNLTMVTERESFDFEKPEAIDYDGDGTPEIIVHLTREGMGEDSGEDRYSVWSVSGGKVAPFAPLAKVYVVGFEDPDHDGRPDPLVSTPYSADVSYSQGSLGCGSRAIDVRLLWHAVQPGFRTDDAVAIAWAKMECAEVADATLTDVDSGEQGFRWAACQRMSGRSEAELEAAYAKRCPPSSDPTAPCDDSLCGSQAAFDEAASAKPPLVLTR